MTTELSAAISDLMSQFSPLGEIKRKDKGALMTLVFDNRYTAQAFFILSREELAKRNLNAIVRRVGRYQVNIVEA